VRESEAHFDRIVLVAFDRDVRDALARSNRS
jgi:hypothetical protein